MYPNSRKPFSAFAYLQQLRSSVSTMRNRHSSLPSVSGGPLVLETPHRRARLSDFWRLGARIVPGGTEPCQNQQPQPILWARLSSDIEETGEEKENKKTV